MGVRKANSISMHKLAPILLVVITSVRSTSPASDAGPHEGTASSGSTEATLRKLDEVELAGIRKREVKFVDTVYAPDVVMFPVYGPFKVEGLDRVREAWRSLYDTFAAITRCEWSERRYLASGAASAWMTCLWSLEGSNSDGQPLEMVLRVTRQYERRRGRWVVVHEHLSAAVR